MKKLNDIDIPETLEEAKVMSFEQLKKSQKYLSVIHLTYHDNDDFLHIYKNRKFLLELVNNGLKLKFFDEFFSALDHSLDNALQQGLWGSPRQIEKTREAAEEYKKNSLS